MLQLIIICYGPALLFGPEYSFKDISLFGWYLPNSGRMTAAIIAFVINYSAYLSEIYRGGIESVNKGQYEAGQVLGMTKNQIFFKVILIQVIKRIVPPMGNEIITLVKDTSLSNIITIQELTVVALDLRKAVGGGLWPLLAAGVFYYVFNLLVAFVLRKVEKKLDYFRS